MEEEKQFQDIENNSESGSNSQTKAAQLSKRERRMLKKEQNKEQRSKSENEQRIKNSRKKAIKYSIWLVVILVMGFGFYMIAYNIKNAPKPVTSGPVHWHARFEVNTCGQTRYLSNPSSNAMAGPMLTHTHGDNKMHIEGTIVRYEDIAVGRFMDGIRIDFSNTTIMDKKNGDICSNTGKPGTLKMFVNNEPNSEFRNYIPKDGDVIRLVFD